VLVRDRPEDRGFAPLPREATPPGDADDSTAIDEQAQLFAGPVESSWDRYRVVLSNPRFLIASVAIGFQNMARYGLLIWVPVHFLGEDWKDSGTTWIAIALPIGMAVGAMVSGWVSDRFFGSNRSRVIGLFMFLAAGCALAMFLLPRDHPAAILMLFLTGFFAYGPQSAFWALCPDLLGRERAGTGTGVMNTFAYAFAGLGEPLIGWMIESQRQTSLIFAVVAAACLISALISPFIRH
jgi:MFS transporter, OPA family, glycerol-3-phosphate transporter